MRGETRNVVPVFSLDGRTWAYPLYATPNSSLVAMESLPDGSMVTLERGYGFFLVPLVISLRRARWTPAGDALEVQTLAVMDSSRGWSVDNFKGLARHRGMKFFIVSDDNNRAYQRTLLVYLEVLENVDPSSLEIPDFEADQKTGR